MKLGRAALLVTFAATAHGFVPTSPPLRRAAAVPLGLKPVPTGSFGASTLGRYRVASRQSDTVANEPELDENKNAIEAAVAEAALQRTECVPPPPTPSLQIPACHHHHSTGAARQLSPLTPSRSAPRVRGRHAVTGAAAAAVSVAVTVAVTGAAAPRRRAPPPLSLLLPPPRSGPGPSFSPLPRATTLHTHTHIHAHTHTHIHTHTHSHTHARALSPHSSL